MMRAPVAVSDIGFGAQYGQGQLWLRGPEGGTPAGQDPDAGFDLPDDTFWLLGHDGQSTAVIPSKGLVVVRMGLTPSKLGYKPQGLVAALVKALD
jgi:CubicO group peptidase (beta-lactamase class C family)